MLPKPSTRTFRRGELCPEPRNPLVTVRKIAKLVANIAQLFSEDQWRCPAWPPIGIVDGDFGFGALPKPFECFEDCRVLNLRWSVVVQRLDRSALGLLRLFDRLVLALLSCCIFLRSPFQILLVGGAFGGVVPIEIKRIACNLDVALVIPANSSLASARGEQRVLHRHDPGDVVGPGHAAARGQRDREFRARECGFERAADFSGSFGCRGHRNLNDSSERVLQRLVHWNPRGSRSNASCKARMASRR